MLGWALPVLLAVSFGGYFHFYKLMDYGKVLHSHRPGRCRVVEGPVQGSEDIEVIEKDGIAFVTSGLLYLDVKDDIDGKIFLYDFSQPTTPGAKLKAVELPIKGDNFDKENFHPHGSSHWMVNGVIRLFIVNHDSTFKHSIEIFDYDRNGKTLIHKKSIKGDALVRPNDVAAAGPDSFFFTNDGAAQTQLSNSAEILLGIRLGTIGYYDGKAFHNLLDGLGGSNGIAFDSKTSTLYVSMILDETINAYKVSKDRKSLTLLSSTQLHSGPDNIFIDSDGSLYTGAHPITYLAVKHIKECSNLEYYAPSQVLRLKYNKPNEPAAVTEVYANDGTEASGSSAAVRYKNQLLVGTVCRQLVHCEIADPSVL